MMLRISGDYDDDDDCDDDEVSWRFFMAKSYLCRWWRRLWEMCSRSCNSMSRWRQTEETQHRHWCHSFAQRVNHMWFDRPWSSSWENWLQILIRRGWGDSWLSGGCYCHDFMKTITRKSFVEFDQRVEKVKKVVGTLELSSRWYKEVPNIKVRRRVRMWGKGDLLKCDC